MAKFCSIVMHENVDFPYGELVFLGNIDPVVTAIKTLLAKYNIHRRTNLIIGVDANRQVLMMEVCDNPEPCDIIKSLISANCCAGIYVLYSPGDQPLESDIQEVQDCVDLLSNVQDLTEVSIAGGLVMADNGRKAIFAKTKNE